MSRVMANKMLKAIQPESIRNRAIDRFSPVLAMVLGAALSLPTWADTQIIYEQTAQGATKQSPILIREGKMRISPPNDQGSYLLFDTKSKTMTQVNASKKSYTVVDEAMLGAIGNTFSQMQQSLNSSLQALPPEKRKQMEAMMGQMMNPSAQAKPAAPAAEAEWVESGEKREVGGLSCRVYTVMEGGKKVSETCAADRGETGMSEADAATITQFAEFMKKITSSMPGGDKVARDFRFWSSDPDRFPIETIRFQNGQVVTSNRLKTLSHDSLAADQFTVPAGFSKQEMGGMPGGAR